ncbi:MAG: hypothetical protein ACJ762_14625 [Solirubrobacteraceae bacterium]
MTAGPGVYGLTLAGDDVVPDVARAVGDGRRVVRLRACRAEDIHAAWPSTGSRRLAEEHPEPGEPPRTIDGHDTAGWRLAAPGWGFAQVARDGTTIDCAREGAAAWRWQRFVVGRALPFAAVAAGLEVLHAGAVAHDGGALAFTGPSGIGKSSVVAALVRRGAGLLSDDALALENGPDLVAHPGPAALALRDDEAARLGSAADSLGEDAGAGGGKHYRSLDPGTAPVPVRRLVFLRRGTSAGVAVRPLAAGAAEAVLGALFAPEIVTRERLSTQLDVIARIVADVACDEIVSGPGAGPDDVADAVLAG